MAVRSIDKSPPSPRALVDVELRGDRDGGTRNTGSRNGSPKKRKRHAGPLPYLNRELAWLDFNARVLHEAADARNPLLERVRFLTIFASNLEGFFQVRISGLRHQVGDPDL